MATSARIVQFTSRYSSVTGRVDFRWRGPGDALPLELTAEVDGDPYQLRAEIWTNASRNDAPTEYAALPMQLCHTGERLAVFRVDLPVHRVGNYRVAARVWVDGQVHWMSGDGIPDLMFRPRDLALEGLNIEEVSVPNANGQGGHECGTLADLMDRGTPLTNGKYTLEWLAQQGKNCIWLLPPFETSRATRVHAGDDAGSPYAITDFFSIRAEISRSARGLPREAARQAALDEFKRFLDKAHALDMRVILDLPLNHVGHRYRFRDLFVTQDEQGCEARQVREGDFSNLFCCPQHEYILRRRLADPDTPRALEFLAPWFFGSRKGETRGAQRPSEIAPGGWFEWPDTLQLNHGRYRRGFRQWFDVPSTPEHQVLQSWLGRVLRFWAVDMGVDGFRVDHLCGMPMALLEYALNELQADVDAHTPGRTVLIVGEDFDTAHQTGHWVDYLQGGWFEKLLRVQTPADLKSILDNPWFPCHLLSLSSHDEDRFVRHFDNDLQAATRMACLLQLLGGPVAEVMGDHFGETHNLPFKQHRLALSPISQQGEAMARLLGRAGRLHRDCPALSTVDRTWMDPVDGGADGDVLVLMRHVTVEPHPWVLVTANFSNRQARERRFRWPAVAHAPLDPHRQYQAHDLLAEDPATPVWPAPLSGEQLSTHGLPVMLAPYQVQVIALKPAPRSR